MARVYNFSAGPSQMPEPVLRTAAAQMLEYGSSGQSVMEMSHRSRDFEEILHSCESLLREVLSVPDNYKILFIQGGASMQFAMVPLNLMNGSGKADYVVSGQFSKKAWKEAARFGDAKVLASSEEKTFSYIPPVDPALIRPDADYVHICYNNTIYGTAFPAPVETGGIPLVADMSSCFLSRPVDVSRFGLIYAGVQKNLGPAGMAVAVIREDLIGKARENTPTMLDYATYANNDSMYNTPPCWCIYMCKLVLEWIRDEVGGLAAMEKRNLEKAAILYDYLDRSALFTPCVPDPKDRSIMNATFVTGDKELDAKFVAQAAAAGFVNLKGHRSVGGMRASIYNAMPKEGVEKLVAFMEEFEAANRR